MIKCKTSYLGRMYSRQAKLKQIKIPNSEILGGGKEEKMSNPVWDLPSAAEIKVKCVGVTEEQIRPGKTEISHQNKPSAGTLFSESDISGCRSNFPFPSCFPLYPSFCWTQLNDVPGDKQWLTTSRQDTGAHRHGGRMHVGVYTAHTARTFRPAAASFANCVPQTWGRCVEQMWLYSVWQAWVKKAEACRLVTTEPVHLFTWLEQTWISIITFIRPSETRAATLLFIGISPFLFVFLAEELKF